MPLPIAVIICTVASPILAGIGSTVKERFDEELTYDELKKIEPILDRLGLYLEQVEDIDNEKELSDMVKARLHQLSSSEQVEIMYELRDHLDQDEYFDVKE